MKRLLLTVVALATLTVAQAQSVVIKKGNEGKRTDPEMVTNGHYLGTIDGLDCILTQSSEGAKGFAEDDDWQVVLINDDMFPLDRRELRMTHHCSLLATATEGKWASMLLVDSSQRKQTVLLKATVSMDSLLLKGGRVDTVTSYSYAKKDHCRMWGATSANGQYVGVLTVVQYKERKEYIAVVSMYDAGLKELWSREFAVGTVDAIYVTDDGRMLTLGADRRGEEEHFTIDVIDNKGGEKFGLSMSCERVKYMRIVNVVDNSMVCTGLFEPYESDPDDELTGGVVTMSFSLDSMAMNGFSMRYFQNEDINIMTNEKTKKIQKERELPNVVPLSYVPAPYGAVVSVGVKEHIKLVNANGTHTHDCAAQGIHLVAVDNRGEVKWVRNLRRMDRQDDGEELMQTLPYMHGDVLCLVKNEHPKSPAEYVISKEAKEFEVGDKSNLVLYRISADGEVSKDILEKKTRQVLGSVAIRPDGTAVLMTVNDSKTRKMEMKFL